MRMRTLTLAAALCMAIPCARLLAAEDISVEATRRDDALEVVCHAVLEVPPDLIWQTLTDYGHLAEFIPGMRSSKVVSQNGAMSIVEQTGEARFLFFTFPIEVTVASTERPPHLIEARLLKGTLKRMDGAYRIVPQAGGRSLLGWTGVVEAESMPPLFGELLMRSIIEDQFRGMVREIERRDGLRREREARR
jgi:carbon monoxide dehydrogenase subunit G